MVAFPSAASAVAAAVDMQRGAGKTLAEADAASGLRIGIAAGDAEVEGADLFGRPVVEAARLCAAAGDGQILVTDLIRQLLGGRGGHTLLPVGELDLKGFERPVAAFEVIAASAPSPEGALPLPLPALLDLREPVPFVGRVTEQRVLEEAWNAASGGGRHAVLVTGEAGAGKTRLVGEFARTVHRRGGAVLFGACTAEVELPYQPFVEALDHALADLSPDLRLALCDGRAGELGRLLPDIAPAATGDAPVDVRCVDRGVAVDSETERYRLFEAITVLLADLARLAPVLVILDDLHWAGRSTMQLLDHLLRSTRLRRVCVVATFRNSPTDIGEPLHEALADLRRRAGVERIALAGFDRAGVHDFVEAATGQAVDASMEPLVSHFAAVTEGNAFLLGELWRHLVEVGCVVRVAGSWSLAAPLSGAGSPDGVREVVGRRIDRLPAATADVLRLAAVTGASFDLDVVAAAADLDVADVLDRLGLAVQAGLVDEASLGRFRFCHALVRDAVEDGLSLVDRRRHHLAVGRALEALGRDVPDELARHFTLAVPLAPARVAIGHARQSAANAMRSLAYDNASTTLRRVLELTEGVERIDVLVDLAAAEMLAANTEESRRLCRRPRCWPEAPETGSGSCGPR